MTRESSKIYVRQNKHMLPHDKFSRMKDHINQMTVCVKNIEEKADDA